VQEAGNVDLVGAAIPMVALESSVEGPLEGACSQRALGHDEDAVTGLPLQHPGRLHYTVSSTVLRL
jgi:hypothetical protein